MNRPALDFRHLTGTQPATYRHRRTTALLSLGLLAIAVAVAIFSRK